MKWLLQLGSIMLLVAVVCPVQEIFDGMEQAGLFEDGEFAIFALTTTLCLVLLVCTLIAAGLLRIYILSLRAILKDETSRHTAAAHSFIFVVPPLAPVPLRI